jgi:transcriptional regulator with XRE-family HTH domain
MNITDIRTEMGFSQAELAGYLGLNRMQVTLAERANRHLPHKVIGKWTRMKYCRDNTGEMDAAMAAIAAEQASEVEPVLTDLVKQYKQKVFILQHKLEDMEEEYNRCLQTQAFVTLLRKLPPENRGKEAWINRIEARVNKTYDKCGPGVQALVSLKLEAALWMLEQLANRYGIV